jgi:arylsulfatase A-like enzyme
MLNRRNFLKQVGICTVGLSAIPCSALQQNNNESSNPSKPNIVLIMADDMGYSDIGCYGGEVDTPNLNSLAKHGTRFKQFYNGARCCPTRASLLTGLYAHQTGIGYMVDHDRGVPGYRGTLNNNCVTIAEVLKPAGYSTYMSGKWHVAHNTKPEGSKAQWPIQRGFDKFYGTITGAGSYYYPNTLTRGNDSIDHEAKNDPDFYYTDKISDNAAAYISDHFAKTPDKPFFQYVAYTSPHWPLHAKKTDIEKYKGKFDQGWDVLRVKRYEKMVKMGLIDKDWDLSERDSRVPAWYDVKNKDWQKRRMEVYAAQIDCMDQGIGRIVKSLKDAGQFENTLIMFLADNGGCSEDISKSWESFIKAEKVARNHTREGKEVKFYNNDTVMPGTEDTYQSYATPWANVSNAPFRYYKHYIHEGGISTPFIAHWPKNIKPAKDWYNSPAHLIDIMATCVDVAGADYPQQLNGIDIHPMEGTSLTSAFNGTPLPERQLCWEHGGNRGMRDGKWKIVARRWNGKWQLYDIQTDRTELNDLADKHPARVEKMDKMWFDWANRANVIPYKKGQTQ